MLVAVLMKLMAWSRQISVNIAAMLNQLENSRANPDDNVDVFALLA